MAETRKLASILAADVAGYSKLAAADEERTLARLRALRSDLIDPTIALHHGRVVKRTGDGVLIEFRSSWMPCAARSSCRTEWSSATLDCRPNAAFEQCLRLLHIECVKGFGESPLEVSRLFYPAGLPGYLLGEEAAAHTTFLPFDTRTAAYTSPGPGRSEIDTGKAPSPECHQTCRCRP
jgi:hypothetical protein